MMAQVKAAVITNGILNIQVAYGKTGERLDEIIRMLDLRTALACGGKGNRQPIGI